MDFLGVGELVADLWAVAAVLAPALFLLGSGVWGGKQGGQNAKNSLHYTTYEVLVQCNKTTPSEEQSYVTLNYRNFQDFKV